MPETELTVLLRQQIYQFLETDNTDAWQLSPYLSLDSYTEKDAHLFYGRDRETGELCRLVETLPVEKAMMGNIHRIKSTKTCTICA